MEIKSAEELIYDNNVHLELDLDGIEEIKKIAKEYAEQYLRLAAERVKLVPPIKWGENAYINKDSILDIIKELK